MAQLRSAGINTIRYYAWYDDEYGDKTWHRYDPATEGNRDYWENTVADFGVRQRLLLEVDAWENEYGEICP